MITTLFDLYKLDRNFPGFSAAQALPDLAQRLAVPCQRFHADIVAEAGCQPGRFIPCIQRYEFEALLFSDVQTLAGMEPGWKAAVTALAAARDAAESPEHINDRPESKPAAHLQRELANPSYRKRRHGLIAARKIGLAKIEAGWAFFAAWLAHIRGLAAA